MGVAGAGLPSGKSSGFAFSERRNGDAALKEFRCRRFLRLNQFRQ
jgi:hypothetical protein